MKRILCFVVLLCGLAWPVAAQDENDLTPYEIAQQRIEAARMGGTTELNLSNLGLTELPPEISNLSSLQHLYLDRNEFTHLPTSLADLPSLQLLSFDDNPLISPPSEVLDEGVPAIQDYLRNQAAWHLGRILTAVAFGWAVIIGIFWFGYRRGRGNRKKKKRA